MAVLALAINQWLAGIYTGFSFGAGHLCSYSYPTFYLGEVRYGMSHADPYYNVGYFQMLLSWTILILVLGKVIEKGLIVRILSLIALALSLVWWYCIERIVSIDINDSDKYIDLLRDTRGFTWTLFGMLVLLVLLQLISIGSYQYKKRRKSLSESWN